MLQTFQAKQLTCLNHKFSSLDLIHLTGVTEQGRMCSICVAQNQIPFEEILLISELFSRQKEEVLSTYPPFKNKEIKQFIERYSEDNVSKENIDKFFYQLRVDIEEAIQQAEQKAKVQLIRHIEEQQMLFQEINRMGEVDKLREYVTQTGENLNEFLKQQWRNSEKNDQAIEKFVSQNSIEGSRLNFKEKQNEIQRLIGQLKNFTIFEVDKNQITFDHKKHEKRSILQKSNLMKSQYWDSQKLTISRSLNGTLQLVNNTSKKNLGQAFLDFVVNPNLSYTMLNYQPKGNNEMFVFGLVSDHNREANWGSLTNWMSFCNQNSNLGLSKYLKGPEIQFLLKGEEKQEFEVRICLKEKQVQLASLPDYQSVISLDDSNKIQSDILYRFFIYIELEGDMIEISEIIESDKFEPFII